MKKLILLSIIAITFYSCNKEFSEVVDYTQEDYQVFTMNNSDSFTYSNDDTVLVAYLGINNPQSVSSVTLNAYGPDGKNFISPNRRMLDDGDKSKSGDLTKDDKIYSTKIEMSNSMVNGNYKFEYIVTNISGESKIAGVYSFTFNNGQSNIAPIISNVIISPDSMVVNDTIPILIRINAQDENGLSDIEKVYFVVYRPNGTTNGIENNLYDNGLLDDNGDVTAGDGIYSKIIEINQTNTKGIWRFEFRAKDRGKKYSNIINYNILIQ